MGNVFCLWFVPVSILNGILDISANSKIILWSKNIENQRRIIRLFYINYAKFLICTTGAFHCGTRPLWRQSPAEDRSKQGKSLLVLGPIWVFPHFKPSLVDIILLTLIVMTVGGLLDGQIVPSAGRIVRPGVHVIQQIRFVLG